MKGRVERSIEQRTAMLAGVSHDLRTILTRFKLELALIGDSPEVDAMRKDIDEMSMMLEDYLAFARGDNGENAQPTDMTMALEELRSDADSILAFGWFAVNFHAFRSTFSMTMRNRRPSPSTGCPWSRSSRPRSSAALPTSSPMRRGTPTASPSPVIAITAI